MYDLVIIGAGSGGLTAVQFAAELGAKVGLVEKNKIGGDCTWLGCVPSKAMLHTAKSIYQAKNATQFGLKLAENKVNLSAVNSYIQQTILEIYQHETPEMIRMRGVDLFAGQAHFVDAHRIEVDAQIIESKKFLIATGAKPIIPPISGLEEVSYLTYEQIYSNERLPHRLVVIGAGATGIELGQAYGRFGAQVTLIDPQPPLAGFDPDISQGIQQILTAEGINFVKGLATAVSKTKNDDIVVDVADQTIVADMLLIAAGRSPQTKGLRLEEAGVVYSAKGIKVNDQLQTNIPHIYAAGDCTGGFQATHYAGWQAFQAARNALLLGSDKGIKRNIPRVVYCDPEVAQTGWIETQARQRFGDKVGVLSVPLSRIDRAVTDNAMAGFIKLVYLQNGRLIGASMIAPHAGEIINELSLAIQHQLSLRDMANTLHAYPTYGIGIQRAVAAIETRKFAQSRPGKIIARISGINR